jgi:predicted TIM-barrel fold metal-dependent hydrolase
MLGPIVDSNVHLWDQRANPVFWLTDRTRVRDLIGDYDSLPDVYTLADYERETAALAVRGVVWSDAGAADPVAAAEWVRDQDDAMGTPRSCSSSRRWASTSRCWPATTWWPPSRARATSSAW